MTRYGEAGVIDETTPLPHSGSGPVAPVATVPALHESSVVPALGTVIGEKYRVDELIARGGMGAVYLATHLRTKKRVALKWMLPALDHVPGAKERFEREALATARIDHPNVIDIWDVGHDRGSIYLVMELLRGETLADFLQRSPALEPHEVVELLMPALRGVAAAHAHQVIHRDLKPENIFLCRGQDGEMREPRVLDFGISKITNRDGPQMLALTRSGAVMGTPYYMSPEQVRGAKDVDARSDIYAFGVMLYEMLAGERPFEAETYNQLILKIATEDPVALRARKPELDPELAAVVERAMARDPEDRQHSVEELALALEPFAGGMLFRATTTRQLTASFYSGEQRAFVDGLSRSRARRSRSFIALGIVLGCAVAGAGYWLLARTRSEAVASDPQPAQLAQPAATAQPPLEAPRDDRSLAAEEAETSRSPARQPPDAHAESAPPAAEPGSSARRARASGTHEQRARERSRAAAGPIEARPTLTPAQLERTSKLPEDWDERISIPSRPARGTPNPAGPIEARDLR